MEKKQILLIILALPMLFALTGCSGGVNGEGSNNYSRTNGTPIIRSASFNDMGWDLIEKGQLESAITKFNQVLADAPTIDEAAEANNGIGWARTFLGSLHDGMPWFEKSIDWSNDAKVGLAAAYVQKGSLTDLEMAYNILYKRLGKENPHFHYVPRRKTGVSDAEVHAMLAYIYAGLGKMDDANDQLAFAKELNPGWENTTIDQIGRMIEFLGK